MNLKQTLSNLRGLLYYNFDIFNATKNQVTEFVPEVSEVFVKENLYPLITENNRQYFDKIMELILLLKTAIISEESDVLLLQEMPMLKNIHFNDDIELDDVLRHLDTLQNTEIIRVYSKHLEKKTVSGFRCFNSLAKFYTSIYFDEELVRVGTFETNSSSAHCVSIDDTKELIVDETIVIDENGYIHLDPTLYGYFGWEVVNYNDFANKMAYVVASSNYTKGDLSDEELNDTLYFLEIIVGMQKYFPQFKGFVFNIPESGKEEWGDPLGGIDHESVGILTRHDKARLLVDKNQWIQTGNDNGEWPDPLESLPTFSKHAEMAVGKPMLYLCVLEDHWREPEYIFKNDEVTGFYNGYCINEDGIVLKKETASYELYKNLLWYSQKYEGKEYVLFAKTKDRDEYRKIEGLYSTFYRQYPFSTTESFKDKFEGDLSEETIAALQEVMKSFPEKNLKSLKSFMDFFNTPYVIKEVKCVDVM